MCATALEQCSVNTDQAEVGWAPPTTKAKDEGQGLKDEVDCRLRIGDYRLGSVPLLLSSASPVAVNDGVSRRCPASPF